MENAVALAQVMGPMYLILGLSLLFYPKPWLKLTKSWAGDHLPLLGMMFACGVLGLISVNMYNVWQWNLWLLVTVTGWAFIVKSAIYFLLPGSVTKNMLKWKSNQTVLMFGAVLSVAIGAALSYYSYMA